jgi:hypothetical protein
VVQSFSLALLPISECRDYLFIKNKKNQRFKQ